MEQKEVKQNSLRAWLLASRPKTLSGAAVPVMIGVALAFNDHCVNPEATAFSVVAAVLCFLFAFIMQIDANLVNDLFDYLRGSDNRETRLGPKRACTEGWVKISSMKIAIGIVTTVACLIGLPLVLYGGLEMILIGMLCVAFCFLYTTSLAGHGLGDVLVLVFFGIVPVCITYYLQHHTVTLNVFAQSLACGLAIDGLLIVNNFRDRDTDRAVGKLTLVVRIGETYSLWLYLCLGVVACIVSMVCIAANNAIAALLPLIYLALHIQTFMNIKRIYRGKALNKCLGQTARNIFIYGMTVATGILL